MNSELIAEIKKIIPEENILENEPMSRHTMFRVGGPADCFVRVTRISQLTQLVRLLHQEQENYYIVGNGSNLLVSDQGYRGFILCTAGGLNQIRADGSTIIDSTGRHTPSLSPSGTRTIVSDRLQVGGGGFIRADAENTVNQDFNFTGKDFSISFEMQPTSGVTTWIFKKTSQDAFSPTYDLKGNLAKERLNIAQESDEKK